MKEFTEEEVVELFKEYYTESLKKFGVVESTYEKYKNTFLKEKGLLKEELEKGKWYRRGYDFIYYTCESNNYGIMDGQWRNDIYFSTAQEQLYIPATDKGVSEALIKEAKRRYSKGCKITWDIWSGAEEINLENFKHTNDESESHHNGLWCECRQLFEEESGKWAEIVEEKEAPLEVIINGETYIKK